MSGREFKASVLGAYERGERQISVARLAKLAAIYDMTLAELLGEEPSGGTTKQRNLRPARGAGVREPMIDIAASERFDEADSLPAAVERFADGIRDRHREPGHTFAMRDEDVPRAGERPSACHVRDRECAPGPRTSGGPDDVPLGGARPSPVRAHPAPVVLPCNSRPPHLCLRRAARRPAEGSLRTRTFTAVGLFSSGESRSRWNGRGVSRGGRSRLGSRPAGLPEPHTTLDRLDPAGGDAWQRDTDRRPVARNGRDLDE